MDKTDVLCSLYLAEVAEFEVGLARGTVTVGVGNVRDVEMTAQNSCITFVRLGNDQFDAVLTSAMSSA